MSFSALSSRALSPLVRLPARLASTLSRAARAAFPHACALCGNLSHKLMCDGCDSAYWNEANLRCAVCAVPLPSGRAARHAYRCAPCITNAPSFDATVVLVDYRAPLDTLAVALKFRARLMVARDLADRLARAVADHEDTSPFFDTIAPVPLAPRRLIGRGYNQAWQIARPLARRLDVRADATLLRRALDTAPQSRLAHRARRSNVEHAFTVTRDVRGQHIGIVDDVMTTGATLDAIAQTLKAAGASRVTNLVAFRTPRH